MPYTISHTAAVLPFARLLARWQMLSAAVIGAMVPDFRLFFPWEMQRFETHSAMSLLTFCLPVGLVTYWLFQILIKVPIIEVLPEGAYARWRPFAAPAEFSSLRHWLLAALGVLLGAMTHLVWDGFTHEGGRGVRIIPFLDDPIDFGRHHWDALRIMQDLGSLVGLVVVLALLAYALRPGRDIPQQHRLLRRPERRRWVFAYLCAAILVSVAFYGWSRLGEPPSHSVVARASQIAVAALRGLAAALLGVSLILDMRLRALRQRSSGPDR
jgi:Domain of unknown function (DUF4184)